MNRVIEFLKEKLKILKSMRLRLFVIIFAMGLFPCIMLSMILLGSYEKKAVDVRTADVTNQLYIISDHLITYNYLQGMSSEVIDAELSQLSNLYDGRILIINSDLQVIRDTYGISQGKTIISSEVIRALRGETVTQYDDENGYIEITTPIVESRDSDMKDQPATIQGVMLTSVATDTIINTQSSLGKTSRIVTTLVAFGLLILSYALSLLFTRPFSRLTTAISDVKDGFTDDPLKINNFLETEHISEAFNTVVGRMKLLDDSRQEFVSNVSHELKTPMTSMKVLADSLLAQEDAPAELYREFMVDITNEIDRENKIISDLLSLVKLDKTAAELTISQVNINDMIELVLKRLRPIARKKDVELTFESYNQVSAYVDEVKLSLAISNLVENAIKYNNDHGWVKVTLDADHQFFSIKVEDSGIGIPEESLGHIFERFYRVDKSHSREIGGTGLGLSITRSAVLMHRGSISVNSVVNEGTVFTVKIPLVYIVG